MGLVAADFLVRFRAVILNLRLAGHPQTAVGDDAGKQSDHEAILSNQKFW